LMKEWNILIPLVVLSLAHGDWPFIMELDSNQPKGR
jgi:hypothetical protein